LQEALNEDLKKKTIYSAVSDTSEQALQELLRRPEVKQAVQNDRTAQEDRLVQELLHAIEKEQAAYGIDETEAKAAEGNLKTLLVSDEYLMHEREQGDYERLETVMKTAEQGKAEIIIIASKDASKQLDGLGGIAGLKRW
jgi:protein pelota